MQGKIDGVKLATNMGHKKLIETGNVLDAIEEAVRSMELDPYFNAGRYFYLKCLTKSNWLIRYIESRQIFVLFLCFFIDYL